jgi:hypothetical protein
LRILNIHCGAGGEFVKQTGGNGKMALGIGKRQQDSIVCGLALLRVVQSVEPRIELLTTLRQT